MTDEQSSTLPSAERVDTAQLLQVGRSVADVDVTPATVPAYHLISLTLGCIGVVGGLFVMWMVPFSVGALVFAELARRNTQLGWPRRLGALTGAAGVLFGGVWLVYALGLLAV